MSVEKLIIIEISYGSVEWTFGRSIEKIRRKFTGRLGKRDKVVQFYDSTSRVAGRYVNFMPVGSVNIWSVR